MPKIATADLFTCDRNGPVVLFHVKPGKEADARASWQWHGVCLSCCQRAIMGGECKQCGTVYAERPAPPTYTPYKDPTMDKRFHAVGIAALRAASQVELVARVNHLDNFTIWASRIVSNAIIADVDTKDREDLDWFQAWHDHLKAPRDNMRDHPMVREIAKTVYEELREAAHV